MVPLHKSYKWLVFISAVNTPEREAEQQKALLNHFSQEFFFHLLKTVFFVVYFFFIFQLTMIFPAQYKIFKGRS